MGQCKYCGRSGWLLSVDSAGLCANCRPVFLLTLSERSRLIIDSQKLVASSTKLDTRLSRCDLIIEQAQALVDYERHGIPTFEPLPSELIQRTVILKDQLIVEAMNTEVANAQRKADIAQGAKRKIAPLSKALLTVREYKTRASRPDSLEGVERGLELQVHEIQVDGYLEEARKAEFKGNKKKALDQYYEALYFLRHDNVADAKQQEQIASIEAKIAELSGEPPS